MDPIDLAPGREPWEQQPGETDTQYGQFTVYRDLGPGRTIAKVARELDRDPAHLRRVSSVRLWRQRATAFDRHREQVRQRIWQEKCREAAEADAKILSAAVGKLAQWLMGLDPARLSEGDGTRLLDVVMRHRRQLMGGAAQELNVNQTVTTQSQVDADILALLDELDAQEAAAPAEETADG